MCFLLTQVGFAVSRRFHQALAPVGLEPRQFHVLRVAALGEGRSQQALAEVLRIPPSRVVAIVDGLEGRDLLERRPHPTDRRVHELYATPGGRTVVARADDIAAEQDAELSAVLEPKEREQLVRLLQKVAAAYQMTPGAHPGIGTADDD